MAKTESTAKAAMLAQAYAIIEARKKLEKQEAEFKKAIRAFMGTSLSLEAGDFVAIITQRTRSDIDKKKLAEVHGEAFVAEFSKITSYDMLEVKPAKRATAEVEDVG